jgi:DNA-binding IclR family transcriptional regulator
MGEGERRVLDVLIANYPDAMSNEALCEQAGYSPTASTMGVILSKLRKLGLVEKGVPRVIPEFMESIAS